MRDFPTPSLTLLEVALFSREATSADSCGRQPAEKCRNLSESREAAAADWGLADCCRREEHDFQQILGLTPKAIR